MWNTIKQPKHLLALDILGVILASFLMLSFSNSFDKIGTLRDWCFYDNYLEALNSTEALDRQENFHNIGDELAMQQNTDISSNFSEATAENVALVEEAKDIIRTKLGNQAALHWERFDDIQVKECDIKNIGFSIVLAYYEPEDNTIYCNRAVMNGDWSKDYRLHTIVHELLHALLEQDKSAFENGTGAFHEGFTEYLAQYVYPTDKPSYYLCFCLAEIFVEDNGLDNAIELFVTGKAEESINQRLGKENLVQNIDSPLYIASLYPISRYDDPIVLDVYLHYVQVTGIYNEEHINGAIERIYPSFDNLATIVYFNSLRQQITYRRNSAVAAFSWQQKIPKP